MRNTLSGELRYLRGFLDCKDRDWKFRNEEKETFIDVFERDGITYVVADKTNGTMKSWLYNLQGAKAPYKHMNQKFYVHRGFLYIYKQLRDEFITYMKSVKHNKIVIMGYSQGGAVAQIIYEDLVYNLPELNADQFDCWIYGAPRAFSIFNKKEVMRRCPNVKRFVNGQDLVSRVPFVFMGYSHIAKKIQIGMVRIPFLFLGFYGLHHFPGYYIKNLEKYGKKNAKVFK